MVMMRHPFMKAYGHLLRGLPTLVLPCSGGSRARVRRVASAMGWSGLGDLETIGLSELVGNEAVGEAVGVRVCEGVNHAFNTSFYELFAISQLAASRRPARIFEFGSFNGRTTMHLAMNAGDDAQVWTIDLPNAGENYNDDTRVGECFAGTRWANRITQLYGDTRTFDFGPYEQMMDMIFIDAGHDYASVQHDTQVAMRLMNPAGCLVLWHDYTQWQGVAQAVDEAAKQQWAREARRLRGTSMAVLDTMRDDSGVRAESRLTTEDTENAEIKR